MTVSVSPPTVNAGQSVVVSASATCPSGTTPLYTYLTGPSSTGPWTLTDAWVSGDWTWPTAGLTSGEYFVLVWSSDGPYTVPQVEALQSVQVEPTAACSAVTLSMPSSIVSGQPINAIASATCPGGAQVDYSFFTEASGGSSWTLQAAWIGPEWTWSTVDLPAGTYQVLVWASDGPYTVPQAQVTAAVSVSS